MSDFVTVFEISREEHDPEFQIIFICLSVFVIGIVGTVAWRLVRGRWPNNTGLFLCFISLFLLPLIAIVPILKKEIRRENELLSAYKNDLYQVSEGVVRLLHEQPEAGHAKGDIININGHELEVNYYRTTPAYRQTISHGGALREGVYAKVYHYKGKILRVDVQETDDSSLSKTESESFAQKEIPLKIYWPDYIWAGCIIVACASLIVRKIIIASYGYGFKLFDVIGSWDWKNLALIAQEEKSPVRKFMYKFINISYWLFFIIGALLLVLTTIIYRI